jgi:hypothetical protein
MPAQVGKEQTKNKKPHPMWWGFLLSVTREPFPVFICSYCKDNIFIVMFEIKN